MRRCAGLKLRAQRQGKFCNSLFKTLLPARGAQGIERSDAANDNAAGPTLLCGARKKSAMSVQHGKGLVHSRKKLVAVPQKRVSLQTELTKGKDILNK